MRLNRKLSTIISLLLILMFCLPYSYAMADGPVPVITKNPTSEAIAIGGKTWFIAHADHATSMTWGLVDANGNIYSLAELTFLAEICRENNVLLIGDEIHGEIVDNDTKYNPILSIDEKYHSGIISLFSGEIKT